MNRAEFEYIFIHANSLAELALQQMAIDLDKSITADLSAAPLLSVEEREEQADALLDAIDFSNMTANPMWDTDELHKATLEAIATYQSAPPEVGSLPEPKFAEPSKTTYPTDPPDLNFGVYLERAYAARAQIAVRVDQGMAQIDLLQLQGLLATLPANMAPLTGPLTAYALAQWLAWYMSAAGAASALGELVILIRALEPVF